VVPADVARTEMTASAGMWGASEMTASADVSATTDVSSKMSTAVPASMSFMVLRHGRCCGN
jgi:hypothetical protein